ncbi:hypothetical protein STAQ_33670 [Allostella sp. ATCC 35155]|nr:hypothetical protein STAQ_33670 [Stella sp. ATCC 35155]
MRRTISRPGPALLLAVALAAAGCQDMGGEASAPPVVAAAPAPPPTIDQVSGRPTVIAGDLVEIDGQRIRIQAIETPGLNTRTGKRALVEMRRIVGRDPVRCQLLELEAAAGQGQPAWVARCQSGETDIGRELVRRGWARARPHYGDGYEIEEAEARSTGRGMWPKPPPARPTAKPPAPRPKAAATKPIAAKSVPAKSAPAKAVPAKPPAKKPS